MINVKTNKGITSLHVNGSLSEIVADVFMIVKKVYDAIEDEEAKGLFKKLVTERINEPFMSVDEMEDALDEHEEELKEAIKSICETLAKLVSESEKDEK